MIVDASISGPIFAVCGNCGHEKSAFLIFRDNELLGKYGRPTMDRMQQIKSRLRCAECGAKNASLATKVITQKIKYVATAESADRVFHKSTCGWMNHVPLDSEIVFSTRDAAIKRGYSPCRSCKP